MPAAIGRSGIEDLSRPGAGAPAEAGASSRPGAGAPAVDLSRPGAGAPAVDDHGDNLDDLAQDFAVPMDMSMVPNDDHEEVVTPVVQKRGRDVESLTNPPLKAMDRSATGSMRVPGGTLPPTTLPAFSLDDTSSSGTSSSSSSSSPLPDVTRVQPVSDDG